MPDLTAVKFQGVDSSDPSCRLSDVIVPVQSFFSNVVGAVAVCTTEAFLGKYQELGSSFASGNNAGDPWAHVDSFEKANFRAEVPKQQASISYPIFSFVSFKYLGTSS